MCGIAGIAALAGAALPAEPPIQSMCDTIRHRGPDDEGITIYESVAMGMRRLAIIDIAGGRQPIANADGSVVTVFNGEIYNFRELRSELEQRGRRFTTNSDTEVIVHAYDEFGDDFVRRLNGMFAIAVHDRRRRRLLLARDQVGIKPLYIAEVNKLLVWGSEIKTILASGAVPRELDVDALGEFLSWEYVPGQKTLLQHVRRLLPGERLVAELDSGRIQRVRYWDIPEGFDSLSESEWIERVDSKLHEAVRRQMVSDVPLGAFLSGGVDSSLVTAAMGRAETFSIGFDDPSYNELRHSSRVAQHLGLNHHTEIIRPDIQDLFERLMVHMDDPISDFSIFPTYLVSHLARQHVTVALSGDGADELFGGYETYLADRSAHLYQRIPRLIRERLATPLIRAVPPRPAKKGLVNKIKRFVEGAAEPESLHHARWRIFVNEALRSQLFTQAAQQRIRTPNAAHIEKLFSESGTRDDLNRSLYVDVMSYLTDNCLVKVDRMSMACSLEVRVPFLDMEMVELAFRMPGHFKLKGNETKSLLKAVAARHVPRDCAYRPKEGFSIPIKNWLANELRPVMEEALDPGRLQAEGLFDPGTVARLKSEHLAGRENHSHVLWGLIMFQSWRRRWLEG